MKGVSIRGNGGGNKLRMAAMNYFLSVIKCKWIKFSKLKAETGRRHQTIFQIYSVHRGFIRLMKLRKI